jgi:uncharacterized LabA/DUF88 family protein
VPAPVAEAETPVVTGDVEPVVPAAPARRSRGRRGSGRGRAAAAAPATPAVEEPVEEPAPEDPAPPAPPQSRGRRTPTTGAPGGAAAAPRSATATPNGRAASPPPSRQAPSAGRGGGSVEALIARQNVLFEEFTQQQMQALREVQKTISDYGRTSGRGAAIPAAPPKVGIFLDVPNLIYAAEAAGVKVHFGKLLDYLTQGRQLVRATAYAPITDDPTTRFETQRFVQPVLHEGYKIVTKPWKRFADGGMKANFDIELAVDILTMSDRLDIVVLLSGDGDFRRVCELVESKGVRVEVVSFAQSTAMELRAVADSYTDLGSILKFISA